MLVPGRRLKPTVRTTRHVPGRGVLGPGGFVPRAAKRPGTDRSGRFVRDDEMADVPQRFDTREVRRYLTCMRTTVSSKGQIVLPAEFRQMDGIEAGQEFDVERLDRGDYRLVRRSPPPNEGAVDWLLACPQKDFFVAIVSESTDTL